MSAKKQLKKYRPYIIKKEKTTRSSRIEKIEGKNYFFETRMTDVLKLFCNNREVFLYCHTILITI